MKFILFNINDTNKHKINKIYLKEQRYINAISFSKGILEQLEQSKNSKCSVIQRLKNKILDKSIEKIILKALEGYNKKWQYILSDDFKYNKYISNKAESLLGYKLNLQNELDVNIFKYIDEYLVKNKSLKAHTLKVLLVANYNKNINFVLVNNLIKEYKNVNILLKETPSSYTLKRIKQINRQEGSTIDIIKKDKKVLNEYNVVYFIDDIKESFPRLRLNKNTCILDETIGRTDKFNSNLIFFKKYLQNNNVIKENIEQVQKEYKEIEIAYVIRKIINELDKN